MKEFAVLLAILTPIRGQSQPWDKPTEQWSDADVKRILIESPWAKPTNLQVHGALQRSSSSRITVRFEGALPIRLALQRVGRAPVEISDPAEFAVVVEFPKGWAQYRDAVRDWNDAQAWVETAGAPRIQNLSVRLIEEKDDVAALVFLFKRTPELTSTRYARLPIFLKRNLKTIKLDGHVGALGWKQSFSVREMVYQGQLEL